MASSNAAIHLNNGLDSKFDADAVPLLVCRTQTYDPSMNRIFNIQRDI